MQLARMLASVSISATGRVAPAGRAGPGVAPEATETTLEEEAKALARPVEFVALVEMAEEEDAKGASVHTAATVVSSLMLMKVEEVRLAQGPRADIMESAALFTGPERPGLASGGDIDLVRGGGAGVVAGDAEGAAGAGLHSGRQERRGGSAVTA